MTVNYFGPCMKVSLAPSGHNELLRGSAAYHLLCANVTMNTLGFKGQLIQHDSAAWKGSS